MPGIIDKFIVKVPSILLGKYNKTTTGILCRRMTFVANRFQPHSGSG